MLKYSGSTSKEATISTGSIRPEAQPQIPGEVAGELGGDTPAAPLTGQDGTSRTVEQVQGERAQTPVPRITGNQQRQFLPVIIPAGSDIPGIVLRDLLAKLPEDHVAVVPTARAAAAAAYSELLRTFLIFPCRKNIPENLAITATTTINDVFVDTYDLGLTKHLVPLEAGNIAYHATMAVVRVMQKVLCDETTELLSTQDPEFITSHTAEIIAKAFSDSFRNAINKGLAPEAAVDFGRNAAQAIIDPLRRALRKAISRATREFISRAIRAVINNSGAEEGLDAQKPLQDAFSSVWERIPSICDSFNDAIAALVREQRPEAGGASAGSAPVEENPTAVDQEVRGRVSTFDIPNRAAVLARISSTVRNAAIKAHHDDADITRITTLAMNSLSSSFPIFYQNSLAVVDSGSPMSAAPDESPVETQNHFSRSTIYAAAAVFERVFCSALAANMSPELATCCAENASRLAAKSFKDFYLSAIASQAYHYDALNIARVGANTIAYAYLQAYLAHFDSFHDQSGVESSTANAIDAAKDVFEKILNIILYEQKQALPWEAAHSAETIACAVTDTFTDILRSAANAGLDTSSAVSRAQEDIASFVASLCDSYHATTPMGMGFLEANYILRTIATVFSKAHHATTCETKDPEDGSTDACTATEALKSYMPIANTLGKKNHEVACQLALAFVRSFNRIYTAALAAFPNDAENALVFAITFSEELVSTYNATKSPKSPHADLTTADILHEPYFLRATTDILTETFVSAFSTAQPVDQNTALAASRSALAEATGRTVPRFASAIAQLTSNNPNPDYTQCAIWAFSAAYNENIARGVEAAFAAGQQAAAELIDLLNSYAVGDSSCAPAAARFLAEIINKSQAQEARLTYEEGKYALLAFHNVIYPTIRASSPRPAARALAIRNSNLIPEIALLFDSIVAIGGQCGKAIEYAINCFRYSARGVRAIPPAFAIAAGLFNVDILTEALQLLPSKTDISDVTIEAIQEASSRACSEAYYTTSEEGLRYKPLFASIECAYDIFSKSCRLAVIADGKSYAEAAAAAVELSQRTARTFCSIFRAAPQGTTESNAIAAAKMAVEAQHLRRTS